MVTINRHEMASRIWYYQAFSGSTPPSPQVLYGCESRHFLFAGHWKPCLSRHHWASKSEIGEQLIKFTRK